MIVCYELVLNVIDKKFNNYSNTKTGLNTVYITQQRSKENKIQHSIDKRIKRESIFLRMKLYSN